MPRLKRIERARVYNHWDLFLLTWASLLIIVPGGMFVFMLPGLELPPWAEFTPILDLGTKDDLLTFKPYILSLSLGTSLGALCFVYLPIASHEFIDGEFVPLDFKFNKMFWTIFIQPVIYLAVGMEFTSAILLWYTVELAGVTIGLAFVIFKEMTKSELVPGSMKELREMLQAMGDISSCLFILGAYTILWLLFMEPLIAIFATLAATAHAQTTLAGTESLFLQRCIELFSIAAFIRGSFSGAKKLRKAFAPHVKAYDMGVKAMENTAQDPLKLVSLRATVCIFTALGAYILGVWAN